MSTAGFFRIKKLVGAGKLLVASRHNMRAIQSEHGAVSNIDASRIRLNRSLHGPGSPQEVAQIARDRMAAASVTKLKKNAVVGIEQIFSLPPDTSIELGAYFQDCLQWSARHFGGIANVLSADVHLDESAPHLHVLILPLVDGRMNGSALVGNRQRLQFLQNDFHAAVAGRYGLSKAPARLQGLARQKTAQVVIQHLRATDDPAQSSALWPVIRDVIDRDPATCALSLGLSVVAQPVKRLRTMAQIFTSKGKGKGRGKAQRGKPIGQVVRPLPIGFASAPADHSLSCVGIAPITGDVLEQDEPNAQADAGESRIVDRSDCDFRGWTDDFDADGVQKEAT